MGTDDKIRVVIVDDVPETRENIRRLLQFENDVEVVGIAGTGREAISVAILSLSFELNFLTFYLSIGKVFCL